MVNRNPVWATLLMLVALCLSQTTTPVTPHKHSVSKTDTQLKASTNTKTSTRTTPAHNQKALYLSLSLYRSGNLHFIFDSKAETLKVFNYRGIQVYQCSCKNEALNVLFWHYGRCPHGTFRLGRTASVHSSAFGQYFTPLYDLTPGGPMHQYGRTGIGIHSGGSGLPNPFAAFQRLIKTHGCLRVHGQDSQVLVQLIHHARAGGRLSYITVQ